METTIIILFLLSAMLLFCLVGMRQDKEDLKRDARVLTNRQARQRQEFAETIQAFETGRDVSLRRIRKLEFENETLREQAPQLRKVQAQARDILEATCTILRTVDLDPKKEVEVYSGEDPNDPSGDTISASAMGDALASWLKDNEPDPKRYNLGAGEIYIDGEKVGKVKSIEIRPI